MPLIKYLNVGLLMAPIKSRLNKVEFLETFTPSEVQKTNYKNFFYNRNGFALYSKNGSFNLSKSEFGVIQYLRKLMASRKKWSNFAYKKRYLLKKRHSRQVFRIKNYVHKHIITPKFAVLSKVQSFLVSNSVNFTIDNKNDYSLNLFELFYIKARFIRNSLEN